MDNKNFNVVKWLDLSTFLLAGLFLLFWLIPKIDHELRWLILTVDGLLLTIIITLFVASISSKSMNKNVNNFIKEGQDEYEKQLKEESKKLTGINVKSEVYSKLSSIAKEKELFERIKNIKKYFGLSFLFAFVSVLIVVLMPNKFIETFSNNQIFFVSFWVSFYPVTQLILAFWLAYRGD